VKARLGVVVVSVLILVTVLLTAGRSPKRRASTICLQNGLRYSPGAVVKRQDGSRVVCEAGQWKPVGRS